MWCHFVILQFGIYFLKKFYYYTVATLWNVLCTKSKYVGTALWYDKQNETFKETKKEVIIGCFFIILGGVLQCIAIFL